MKKLKFLLLALVATISLGAWAQTKASLADGVYYLYDSASKMYMSRGQNYRARCVVDNSGIGFNVATTDGQTTISLPNYTNNTIFNAGGTVYCDNTSNNKWEIDSYGAGYVIKDLNSNGNNGQFLTINGDKQLTFTSDVASATVWSFQTYSEREATLSANKLASSIAALRAAGSTIALDATSEDFATELATNWAAKNVTSSLPEQGTSIAEKWNSAYNNAGTPDYNMVKWSKSGLANGLYKITVTASYRMANNAVSYNAYTNNQDYQLVNFYANQEKFRVAPLFSEGFDTNLSSNCVKQDNEKWYPNGTASCAAAFDKGNYMNELYVYISDGNLEYGFNGMNLFYDNWLCYKNFTLTYYSNTVSEEDAEAILSSVPIAKMSQSAKEALETAKANFENNKNFANYKALETAIANANASIAVYASIKKWYDDAEVNLSEEGYTKFLDETKTIKSAYDDGTITDGVEENATLKSLYEEYIKKYYAPGADITDIYIKNAKLLNGKEGWNCLPDTYSDNFVAEDNGNIGVLEFYAGWGSLNLKKYEMLQTINLPAGEYKLSSNAFFRYGGSYDVDKTKSLAYMKCGNDQTLLPTLGSVEGLSSYANSRGEAISAFEDGLYETSTTFKLLESSDVTVGYVGTFDLLKSWFISGPLKLTYVGPVSLEGYIADIVATLDKVPEGMMEKSLKQALTEAVTAAQAVLAKYNGDPTSVTPKEANDACEALKVAINNAEPSVKVYKAVKDAIDEAADKAQALDEDGQMKFNELIADVQTAYDEGTIIDGEKELATINSALIEATKTQTTPESNFTGIITNAAITSTTGWNNSRVNSGEQYTDAPDNTYFDVYNETRNMTQDIGNLKSGLYILKCATRASGGITSGNIYVSQNGSNLSSTDIHKDGNTGGSLGNGWSWTEVTFQVTDEAKSITIGFYAECGGNQWAGADNFTLTFVGKAFDATLTKIGDAAYSTMYLDYPVEIPENVEAYYVTVEGKTATMNAIEGVIPANCGVILKAEDAGKVTFIQTSTAATTDVTDNVLIGFVKDTEVNNGKAHYAFSYKDDKVAFYIPASAESDTDPTSKFTAKANKAYLEIEGTSSSKIDIAWGGEVTGINAVNEEMGTKDGLYNINGMRVNSNYKGIVLKGNKKFLQK